MWTTEKSIHKCLCIAAQSQPALENTGWCYSLYSEPLRPCRVKGTQRGRLTVWPWALGPKNTALKTSESYGGRRIKCKCSQMPKNRRRLFHGILGLGNVPEAISQGGCPDTSKEELALINPVPHFLLRTANLEVYNTTTVSHRAGASGLSGGHRERGGGTLTSVV